MVEVASAFERRKIIYQLGDDVHFMSQIAHGNKRQLLLKDDLVMYFIERKNACQLSMPLSFQIIVVF